MWLPEEGKLMLIDTIYQTISGEGKTAGTPCTVVRTYGCNVKCTYCDTIQTHKPVSIPAINISEEVAKFKPDHILLTGGEPLLQKDAGDFVLNIRARHYRKIVEIETNGTVPPPSWMKYVHIWTVDIKCPSSGVKVFEKEWLKKLRKQDQLKLVANKQDIDFVKNVLKEYRTRATFVLSPVMSKGHDPFELSRELATLAIEYGARLSLQMHKIVGLE